jgi:hypothetical protein
MSPRHRSAVAIAHARRAARLELLLHLARGVEFAGDDQRLGEVGCDGRTPRGSRS